MPPPLKQLLGAELRISQSLRYSYKNVLIGQKCSCSNNSLDIDPVQHEDLYLKGKKIKAGSHLFNFAMPELEDIRG